MAQHAEAHHAVRPALYVTVWAALVGFTVITVTASLLDMGHFVVFTALLIATVKASLVLLYFMHLRFVRPLYAIMVIFTLSMYGVFILLTFADYLFR